MRVSAMVVFTIEELKKTEEQYSSFFMQAFYIKKNPNLEMRRLFIGVIFFFFFFFFFLSFTFINFFGLLNNVSCLIKLK